jgi:hypothetical protein
VTVVYFLASTNRRLLGRADLLKKTPHGLVLISGNGHGVLCKAARE